MNREKFLEDKIAGLQAKIQLMEKKAVFEYKNQRCSRGSTLTEYDVSYGRELYFKEKIDSLKDENFSMKKQLHSLLQENMGLLVRLRVQDCLISFLQKRLKGK